MPQNMTHDGVASGKKDREAEGATTVIYDRYTLNDYDPDSDGSGNDFDPTKVYGVSRYSKVNVSVSDNQAYMAQFDRTTGSGVIRLYALDGTGEVGNSTTVDVQLDIEVRGQG